MAPTLRKRTAAQVSAPIVKKAKKTPVKSKSAANSVPKANGTAGKNAGAPKKGKAGKGNTKNETPADEEEVDSGASASANSDVESWKNAKSVYDFKAKLIRGGEISLEKYKGHVLLIVNVASNCGHTKKNYEQLVEIDEKYRESKGLRILAFPCNQFGRQEPGDNETIMCKIEKRNVKFDVFEKIDVNGNGAHPLWKYLRAEQPADGQIKWNFSKFIIDKEGKPVARFAPKDKPLDLVPELEKYW